MRLACQLISSLGFHRLPGRLRLGRLFIGGRAVGDGRDVVEARGLPFPLIPQSSGTCVHSRVDKAFPGPVGPLLLSSTPHGITSNTSDLACQPQALQPGKSGLSHH